MSQPPYAQTPYAQPPKPPLPRRARNGAWIAGAVSFSLLSLGWTLLFGAILLALIGGIFLWVAQLIRRGGPNDAGDEAFLDFLSSFDVGAAVPFLVIAGVVGLALMVLAPFLSRWILGAHQVTQPWAVTGAASGVAIVAGWIVGGVLGAVAQVVTSFAALAPDPIGTGIAWASVSGLLAIVVTAAIGLFSWWWMAHLMRPRSEPLPTGAEGR
jgi:hypothetical protein